jgi:hypothetical protein
MQRIGQQIARRVAQVLLLMRITDRLRPYLLSRTGGLPFCDFSYGTSNSMVRAAN